MIRTKSKPQPSQPPSQSLRRNVLRVIVHNDGTAGEPQFTYSGAADCPTAAPYLLRFLPKCLVKRYRYSSKYRTTVRETLLISYCKYAASQARPGSQPASQQQWRGTQAAPATAHSLAGTAAHRGCLPARQGATPANPVGWDQAGRLKDLDTSEVRRRAFLATTTPERHQSSTSTISSPYDGNVLTPCKTFPLLVHASTPSAPSPFCGRHRVRDREAREKYLD